MMLYRYRYAILLGGVLLGLVWAAGALAQQPGCQAIKTLVNTSGQLADMQVGSTPVIVLSINQAACQRVINNMGTSPMRCLPSSQGAPTPTQGLLINSGSQFLMGTEGREEWKCVATTATPTVASTIEGIP